uniref:KIB1-4 beta-propeller domain-containing protein n=1 Tax=Aegilops tauschii TaxID=37682 RepID=M8CFC1_AEGTA
MHLVNPITDQQVALPSVTTIEYVKPIFDESGLVHEYEYPSHSARRSYIAVLIHRPYTHLSFARVGDDKWTLLEPHCDYQDCTYKDGLLYATSTMGEIHAFDLSCPDVTMKIIKGRDASFDPDVVHMFRLHGVPDYHNDGAESLVEIDCLPEHALFLGLNDSLCLNAKDYPALKGNHAYFTDDQQYNQGRKSSRRDIGVVDFGNYNSKEDLVSPQLWSNWPSPMWITPSLTAMKLPPNDHWLSGPLCGLPKIEEGTLRGLFANLGIPISIGPTGMLQGRSASRRSNKTLT